MRWALISAIALTGCASGADLLQQPPTRSFTTSASADQARDCILSKRHGIFTLLPIPNTKGWTLTVAGSVNGNNAAFVIEIIPTGNMTRVDTHVARTLLVTSDIDETVGVCEKELPSAG